jgi:hypothetical protein
MYELVVTQKFGPYEKGARITDPQTVAQVLATNPHLVVKVEVSTPAALPAAEAPVTH